MAITINGTANTVAGVATGGINDNVVDNGTMADDAIGIAELSASGTASSSTFLRGDNAWAASTGGILQTKSRLFTGFQQTTGISNSGWTEISEAFVEITPTSTSNYIRLGGLISWEGSDGEDQYSFRWKRVITGGSTTQLYDNYTVGSRPGIQYKALGSGGLVQMPLSEIYDNPNTTSSVKYVLEVFVDGANQTLYLNRTHDDLNDPRDERSASLFVAQELASATHTHTVDDGS